MSAEGLFWRCHVCGDCRPDRLIKVETYEELIAGASARMNVRYCADRQGCAAVAPLMARDWAARARPEPPDA